MTLHALIIRFLLITPICMIVSSCSMRYVDHKDVSSINLARPKWRLGASQENRVSSYLPGGERKSGFEITRVESIRESRMACGNPLIVMVMTFGTVPVTLPVLLDVAIIGRDRGKVSTRHYSVEMGARYSVWNNFVPKLFEDRAIARGLLDSVDRDQKFPQRVNIHPTQDD